jgi:hypothetical protein
MRLALVLVLASCNVESLAPDPQGVNGQSTCGALAVVRSDYVASSIAAIDARGSVLSPALVPALSGDIALPHDPPAQGTLVVLDRYPAAVVTWLDTKTARVTAQLRVTEGFPTNPHDYLEVDDERALVTRYGVNPEPSSPLNAGNDVLVLNRRTRTVEGRVDLSALNGTALARPDRMTRIGSRVFVLLGRLARDFQSTDTGLVVGLDTTSLALTSQTELSGFRNCVSLARSPSNARIAIGCSGLFRTNTGDPSKSIALQRQESGIAVLDVRTTPPSIVRAISFADQATAVGLGLGFANEDTVVATTYGDKELGLVDSIVSVSVRSGEITRVHQAKRAFVLGDIACPCPGSTVSCVYTDAERGSVETIGGGGGLQLDGRVLLPRMLGGFYP